MNAIIIIIGAEILLGQVTDTNSGLISRSLAPLGIEVVRTVTVDDRADEIARAVEQSLADADIVITTGGLGPTKDDITKGVLCRLTGGELIFDQPSYDNLQRVMRVRGREVNELTRQQAMVPSSCTPIVNRCGTAPIMWFDLGEKCLISMPGVPFETRAALENDIIARLADRFARDEVFAHRVVLLSGRSESSVAEQIADWEASLPEGFHLAYLPNQGYLRLRIDGRGCDAGEVARTADQLHAELAGQLKPYVWLTEDLTPAEALLRELIARGLTVSTAESCTGGGVSAALTSIAGSSAAVMGGVVSYSNEAKQEILGVAEQTLAKFGAVSLPTVKEMAAGSRRLFHTDLAIATSGIAGPGGGTPEKPVGTVCFGLSLGDVNKEFTLHLPGDRQRVTTYAVNSALIEALKLLVATPEVGR